MISAIDLRDVEEATATPLDCGVIFRLPYAGAGAMLLGSLGDSLEPPNLTATGIDEFREQSKRHAFFGYRGCDLAYHYFSMPSLEALCVSREELELDSLPFELGLCLFVAFRGDILTIPDPRTMKDVDPYACHWALGW